MLLKKEINSLIGVVYCYDEVPDNTGSIQKSNCTVLAKKLVARGHKGFLLSNQHISTNF